jgi:hypothetical protein
VRRRARPGSSSTCAATRASAAQRADRAAAAVAELQEQYDDLLAVVDELADRLDAPQRRP